MRRAIQLAAGLTRFTLIETTLRERTSYDVYLRGKTAPVYLGSLRGAAGLQAWHVVPRMGGERRARDDGTPVVRTLHQGATALLGQANAEDALGEADLFRYRVRRRRRRVVPLSSARTGKGLPARQTLPAPVTDEPVLVQFPGSRRNRDTGAARS